MGTFKRCPGCSTIWEKQDEFISDPDLELNGYKADFEDLEYGMFFFTHKKEGCFSTMVIEVSEFLNLYDGPRYRERKTGEEVCPGYCHEKSNLERCDALCECAFVREITHILKQKNTSGS